MLREQAGPELLKRAADEPEFTPRALVFADSPDGHASFVDISLAEIIQAA